MVEALNEVGGLTRFTEFLSKLPGCPFVNIPGVRLRGAKFRGPKGKESRCQLRSQMDS